MDVGRLLETVDDGYGGRADGGGVVGLPDLGGTGGADIDVDDPSGQKETDSNEDEVEDDLVVDIG